MNVHVILEVIGLESRFRFGTGGIWAGTGSGVRLFTSAFLPPSHVFTPADLLKLHIFCICDYRICGFGRAPYGGWPWELRTCQGSVKLCVMSEKPIIIFKCTLNIPYRYDWKWYFNTGGKKAGGKKAHLQTETLFYPLYVYKKHTVNTGGKKGGG